MQKKTTKIAIVAYSLDLGGLSRVVTNLYELLYSEKGILVELLLLDQCDNLNTINEYKNFNVSSKNKGGFFKRLRRYLAFKKYLKKSKFDYIIDQRYRLNPFSEFIISKFIYPKTKIIYNIHSSRIETYLQKQVWFTNYLYNNAFAMVCCSNGIKKSIEAKYGLNNLKCIYNSIGIKDYEEKSISPFNFKYIIAVGRIEPLKQFDRLIEVYSKSCLPNNQIKLVLVGDGSQKEDCEVLANSLKISNNLVFTGSLDNPKAYIQNALFLVLSSKYEGFPMVLLEAMACSTPAISFDLFSGPNEIIKPNVNGILVKDQDFEALLKAMNKLFNNKELLDKYSKNAKNSIMKFSHEKIKKSWLLLLKQD
ncbi:glycosyltransferase [Hyunsoonleella aestuarii]|uniref:Glycosyltransferase family 4 protein n=1 Tax=Hyunsoonleella aestuarii TaxID=912802 RepID=A0ABP8E781_9FLAO|nr:glycosyltransferase [Hyunsoonleella aestuarii]